MPAMVSVPRRDESRPAWTLFNLSPVVLFLALAAWTGLIIVAPGLQFHLRWRRAQVPLEAASVVVLGLTCTVAYFLYSLRGTRVLLLQSLAFLVRTLNQLFFRIVIVPGSSAVSDKQLMYFCSAGRLLAGVILLAAAIRPASEVKTSRPWVGFVLGSLAVIAILAAIQTLLWVLRSHLPALWSVPSTGTSEGRATSLSGITATNAVLGVGGAVIYLVAALSEMKSHLKRTEPLPWLPAALVVAAFSHLHYMFLAPAFSDRVSTADLLRLLFLAILVAGFVWGVRQAFRTERDTLKELSHAYQRERLRVAELEHMDRAKAELFNILTHELLHPVAAIRAFAVTLSSRWQTLDDQSRLTMVQRLGRESASLRDMAEEAVTMIDMEGSGFTLFPGPTYAVELARQAAEAAGEVDGRLKIHMGEGCESALVYADHARVLQVFRNLLSNADKYSGPGTPVELSLSMVDGEVVFAVKNQGSGIVPDDLPRLFQPFSRVTSNGSHHARGSGLGLYICRRIVEAHGGRIWIDSEPGKETTASFSLPSMEGSR